MSEIPNDLSYSKNHEWVRFEGDDIYLVGITDYAQSQLGDIVFVDLPEKDVDVHAGDEVLVVESVKTAADVYSPLSGEIVEVNEALSNEPAKVNSDPYGDGWMFRIKIKDKSELNDLLSHDAYVEEIDE